MIDAPRGNEEDCQGDPNIQFGPSRLDSCHPPPRTLAPRGHLSIWRPWSCPPRPLSRRSWLWHGKGWRETDCLRAACPRPSDARSGPCAWVEHRIPGHIGRLDLWRSRAPRSSWFRGGLAETHLQLSDYGPERAEARDASQERVHIAGKVRDDPERTICRVIVSCPGDFARGRNRGRL